MRLIITYQVKESTIRKRMAKRGEKVVRYPQSKSKTKPPLSRRYFNTMRVMIKKSRSKANLTSVTTRRCLIKTRSTRRWFVSSSEKQRRRRKLK